jgi:protein-S-isoprenylcysteine O-methyltransferase Ste14
MGRETRGKDGMEKYLSVLPFPIFMAVVLFITAGRVDYWQGWVFIAVYLFFTELIVFLLKNHEFRNDREREKKLEGWDKASLQLYNLLGMVTLVIAGLDSGRFKWSLLTKPALFLIIGVILFSLGSLLIIWARFANHYFGGVFITQSTEAEQTVADQGPYQLVRHPGYIGMMLTWVAMAFIFGSLWSLIPVAFILGLFVVMTNLEDQVLIHQIQEYREYSKRTRYRLIPGIW